MERANAASLNSFDAKTVVMMGRVCDEAWDEAQSRLSLPKAGDGSQLRSLVVSRVMAAVIAGQKDPERLRAIALEALDEIPDHPARAPHVSGCYNIPNNYSAQKSQWLKWDWPQPGAGLRPKKKTPPKQGLCRPRLAKRSRTVRYFHLPLQSMSDGARARSTFG